MTTGQMHGVRTGAHARVAGELREIVDSLRLLSARIDGVGRSGELEDGLAIMALDQAGQAVALALLDVEACLIDEL